jgi:hypothetical protein
MNALKATLLATSIRRERMVSLRMRLAVASQPDDALDTLEMKQETCAHCVGGGAVPRQTSATTEDQTSEPHDCATLNFTPSRGPWVHVQA